MEHVKLEITNERARKEWAWLVDKVGLRVALAMLQDYKAENPTRRMFPLNVIKWAGLGDELPRRLPEHQKQRPAGSGFDPAPLPPLAPGQSHVIRL